MTDKEMVAITEPLNADLRNERKRQDMAADEEELPKTLAKYKASKELETDAAKIDALNLNIVDIEKKIQAYIDKPVPKQVVHTPEGDAVDRKIYSYAVGFGWSLQFPRKWHINLDR